MFNDRKNQLTNQIEKKASLFHLSPLQAKKQMENGLKWVPFHNSAVVVVVATMPYMALECRRSRIECSIAWPNALSYFSDSAPPPVQRLCDLAMIFIPPFIILSITIAAIFIFCSHHENTNHRHLLYGGNVSKLFEEHHAQQEHNFKKTNWFFNCYFIWLKMAARTWTVCFLLVFLPDLTFQVSFILAPLSDFRVWYSRIPKCFSLNAKHI